MLLSGPTADNSGLHRPQLGIKNIALLKIKHFFPGINEVQSRAQSGSSGEFSLNLENEPWSNGSSPVQHPPSRGSVSSCQSTSDTSTPPHTLKLQEQQGENVPTISNARSQTSNVFMPKENNRVLSQDFWLTRGSRSIRRGSRGTITRCSSDSGDTGKVNSGVSGVNSISSPGKSNAESTRATVLSPVTVLYVEGKSSSMSGCLNCFSTPQGKEGRVKRPRSPKTLPRASSVISTAEGSSRHSSVSSYFGVTVRADLPFIKCLDKTNDKEEAATQQQPGGPDPSKNEPKPIPPEKPPRDPTLIVPKSPAQELLFDSSFTFNSVFSNTIFSDSVNGLEALSNNQNLRLNPALKQNCPLGSRESLSNSAQAQHGK